MKRRARTLAGTIVLGLCLVAPAAEASRDHRPFSALSAEWWQWALSIPTPDNPLLDTSGGDCMVGQRGDVWFLAGAFGGGRVTRRCSVPENKKLYFPIVNSVNVNSPGVCGQPRENMSVEELRAASRAFIDGTTKVFAEVDGKRVKHSRRVQSEVFDVALPEDNLFDAPCASADLGNVPAGIYSPGVDEGIYVLLKPLAPGRHKIRIRAENPSEEFSVDVTYHLDVVPVLLE